MPEGPEILITTQYLMSKLKNKKILSIVIISGRYTHQKIKGYDVIKKSLPVKIKNIDSKGKFMWFELSNNNDTIYLLNTFGMTGRWSFKKSVQSRIKFIISSRSRKNKTRDLYFIDQRNFGTVEFADTIDVLENKLDKLAPDILKSNMSNHELFNHIKTFITKSRKDLNLVKLLMDQHALVSGIGNYLTAEILYDSQINPHRSLADLSENELKKLVYSMRKIPKLAYCDNITGYMDHFKNFMNSHAHKIKTGILPNYHPDIKNKKFSFNVYQSKFDPFGNKVQRDEIVKNRVIYWVPAVQS